ncbi:Major Facilitator Superfamily [Popillia japonica]|uniref:Major Facilitator Superfamily n=1 Tax=Popillia japonica TaxID=7064 RepID=A0AAW1K3D0_POPJA
MVTLSLMLLYGTRHAFLQTVTYLAPKTISSNCSARTKSAGAREQSTQQGTLIWNPGEQNYIFSAYYLGCSATHIPAGALADIHGVHSRPYSHPFISDEEKCSLAKEFGTTLPKRIPWKDILTDSTVWAMVVAQFGHRFLRFIAYTYLPLFYSEVLCIDIVKDMYKFIIIPAVLQWVFTLIFGYTADYLIRTRYTPVAYARVLFTSLGMTVASIFILVSSYLETNKSAILMCFIVATISRAAVFAGLTANVLDRTRHFTGTVQGLQDGLSTLSGVWFHFLVRYICANNTAAEWRKFFWLTLTVAVSSNTVYFVWGESGRAKWDKVTDEYVSYRHPVPEKNKTESPS